MKSFILLPQEGYEKMETKLDKIEELLASFDIPKIKKEWLTNSDACKFLSVTPRTMQNYRDRGILSFSQVGSKIYYRASDLEKHLETHYVKSFANLKRGGA